MRKYFNPWGGIIIGVLLLIPYLFLGRPWNFLTYIMIFAVPLLILYVIIEEFKKRKESKTPEE